MVERQKLFTEAFFLKTRPFAQVKQSFSDFLNHKIFDSAKFSWYVPQLALLAGNLLTYFAAVSPLLSTGFWDRQPRSTPGRLRRLLAQASFPNDYPFEPQLRKKASVTDHLPRGILAHRRTKTV